MKNKYNYYSNALTLFGIITIIFSLKSYAQSCTCSPSGTLIHTENFSNANGWTITDNTNGSLDFGAAGGTLLNYNNPQCSDYNNAYDPLGTTLSDVALEFYAACKMRVISGNAPAHFIMAFTAGTADPLCTNAAGNPATDQDALFVSLLAPNTPGSGTCCTTFNNVDNLWQFTVHYKDGATLTQAITPINLPAVNTWYYLRLIRDKDCGMLQICTNQSFTNHIAGSPVCFDVPLTSTGYNTIYQGAYTWGSHHRNLNMDIDVLLIYSEPDCAASLCPPRYANLSSNNYDRVKVYPNPIDSEFKIELLDFSIDQLYTITITDGYGRRVKDISAIDIPIVILERSDLASGIYFLSVMDSENNKIGSTKILVQ